MRLVSIELVPASGGREARARRDDQQPGERAHENRCYVKLALVGLSALAFAAPAYAERIGPAVDDAALASAPDGTPSVAFVRDGATSVATRAASGWTTRQVYPAAARIAGLAVGRDGGADVLLEDPNNRWLTLITPQTITRIVKPGSKVGTLGPAGLALDASGAPVVAYTAMRGRLQPKFGGIPTYLRLARLQGTRLRTSAITRRGFPQSYVPPAATPVLVDGRIHVVETYTSAAIEWQPKRRGGWIGQYLFASVFGSPVGPVAAVAAPGGAVWSAWTQDYPEFGETHVMLNLRRDDETTTDLVKHGALVSLTLADGDPEVAANDWVDLSGERDYAGLITNGGGNAVELDGRLVGYLSTPNGARQVLLVDPDGLEWYGLPSAPSVHVVLTAMSDGRLSGRVEGAHGGNVELYREQPGRARALIATVALGADGSFAAQDAAPTSPTLYRAVYRDPTSGAPCAALTRSPIGTG